MMIMMTNTSSFGLLALSEVGGLRILMTTGILWKEWFKHA